MAEPTFIACLSEKDAADVKALGRRHRYDARDVLLREGDPVDDVIILETGLVKVHTVGRGGEELILDLRGPGDVLGEMSAIDGALRSATVSALVDTEAFRIPAPTFLAALVVAPELSMGLLRHLVQHVRDSDRSRLQYVSASAFERTVRTLDDFASRHGEPQHGGGIVVARGLSHQELADAAAISLPAFSRGLRKLRHAGVVSTAARRALVISDLGLFRQVAAAEKAAEATRRRSANMS